MSAIKPFSDVISDLTQCCQDKRTGVFFITTDANRSAYLTLKRGEIETVNYTNKRGIDAIEQLSSVEAGACKFSPSTDSASFRPQSLPATADILAQLAGESSNDGAAPGEMANTPQTAPKSVLAQTDDDLLQLLVEFMGPMASVVYDEVREKTANIKILIKKLAAEIPDDYQRSEFTKRAHKLTRGDG